MPCWIYIGGYPGVGKLTIAKEIQALIPKSKILSNHDLIDRIDVARGHPEYNAKRMKQRRQVLDEIGSDKRSNRKTWIFTDARSNDPIGFKGAEDYEIGSFEAGVPFVSVVLSCSVAENIRRLNSRNAGGTTKLTDPKTLVQIREKEVMYCFRGERGLELDVTDLTPMEAALVILAHAPRFRDTGLAGEPRPKTMLGSTRLHLLCGRVRDWLSFNRHQDDPRAKKMKG